jgi:hypothetical protein
MDQHVGRPGASGISVSETTIFRISPARFFGVPLEKIGFTDEGDGFAVMGIKAKCLFGEFP